MLNFTLTLNREFLEADKEHQKLFAMLKVRPTKEAAETPPPVNYVCLIDTSGSMYEVVGGEVQETGRTFSVDGSDYREVSGGVTKIDLVIESLKELIQSRQFNPEDRLAIIRFDDEASTLLELSPITDGQRIIDDVIQQLRHYSGGTRLGLGMRHALDLLSAQSMVVNQVLLFTDGQTFDEDLCKKYVKDFHTHNISISALGVGEYEENLLEYLSDNTAGRLHHLVAEAASGTQVAIADLPKTILGDFRDAQSKVITNMALSVVTVKGVKLVRLAKVYPTIVENPLDRDPYPIGNIMAGDETVFVLEFDVQSRSASRVRIAQLGFTYDIPGKKQRKEVPPQNIVAQFVNGAITPQMDAEVMGYVQQLNVAGLVKQSMDIVDSDPVKAEKLLETASRMTKRWGNDSLTESLDQAQDELRKTRKLSPEFRKTVKLGSKGKTVRINDDLGEQLSQDAIRQLTGT
jgi:Ca-activated chloride channel family protein